MALHTIELFSGVGMLGDGLRAGLGYLGIETRTVCHVEREAYAAAVIAARMEEGSLDAAPVWSDLCTFDARAFRGKVDCIVAGFPCQDLSVAGKRAGLDGKRSGLFFEVCRIATDSGARLMFLENVGGIASATATVMDEAEGELDERAAARVVGELADLGWDAEWLHVSASDVGASHVRERWFCFAWRELGDPYNYGSQRSRVSAPDGRQQHADSCGSGEKLGNAKCARRTQAGSGHKINTRWKPKQGCCEVADPSLPRLEGRELGSACNGNRGGKEAHGSTSQFRGLFAPGPADPQWSGIINANPWRAPALESNFCGMVDGVAFAMDESRAQRLRCCGNGVVALQAATSFVLLARRAGIFE